MRPFRSIRPFLFSLALGVSLAAASHDALAAACSADAEARALLAAQQQLQQSGAASQGDDGDVSAGVQKSLRTFKDALVKAIDARLACTDEAADAKAVERALGSSMSPKGPSKRDAPVYGNGLDFTVQREMPADPQDPRAASAAPMLVVRSGTDVACGDDNVILGYAWDRAANRWSRVLTWQSPDYKDVSGAYGDGVAYLRLAGGQFVLIHGTPWCTSRWSMFAIDVIAPKHGDTPQRTLFHASHNYARGDVAVTLKPRPDGFEVRAEVRAFDGDLMTRTGIYRFHADGDTVARVQPAANNGRDFVDEWLQVDDALARAWSDPAAAAQLMPARAQVLALNKAGTPFNYNGVRACTGDAKRFEVELDASTDDKKPVEGGSQRFIGIRQERNGFTALSMRNAADARCHGPDLMAGQKRAAQ